LCRSLGGCGLQSRIHPALVDAGGEAVRLLRIDRALAHQATESRLNMPARAGEAIVELKMAECGVEIVAPHQIDDAAAEPDALGMAGGALQGGGGLGEFVYLFGGVFVGLLLLLLLVLRRLVLRESRRAESNDQSTSESQSTRHVITHLNVGELFDSGIGYAISPEQ